MKQWAGAETSMENETCRHVISGHARIPALYMTTWATQ